MDNIVYTLPSFVPSPGVIVAESLNRDLCKVSQWCDISEMKLNASKTKTMIVSRSRRMHPHSPVSPPITILGTVVKEADHLHKLGVTYLIVFVGRHILEIPCLCQ